MRKLRSRLGSGAILSTARQSVCPPIAMPAGGVERTAKFKLGTAQRPVARRPRLHLKGSTQNTAPDIGRRHLGAVDIEVAVHIGRRHRRTGPTERHAVQVSVYQHAPMREVLERQK